MTIILAFDNDKAGQKAQQKAIDLILEDKSWQRKESLTDNPEQDIDNMLYYEKQRAKEFEPLTQTKAIEAFGVDKQWADNKRKEYFKSKHEDACSLYDDYENLKTKAGKILFNGNNLEKKVEFILYLEKQMRKCQEKIKRFDRLADPPQYKFTGNEFDIPAIKQIDIQRVLEYYGIEIIQDKILCPFHQDAHPSCHIYKKSNTFYCFSCSASGDVISLVEKLENTNFITACKILNKMMGYTETTS